ncbi:MAG: hypothetical protein AMJ63_10365 [Myxococcales bacterium SG8_38_1]|nr:MAG: hypothetical protein AMJ63_10365 [Myxococcales bacterium SG8_38_1]
MVVEAVMSARTPLVLLVIALVLLGYVLAFERGRPSRSEINSRSGLLVEALVRDRITRIRIASGNDRVALRRDGEGFDETWTLEEPYEGPADAEPIEDYIRNWEYAIPVRTLQEPSPEDIEQFGVDSPTAEVTFEMGRATVRVSLASGTPVDGGGYVRIDDERAVVVVGKDVVELFSRTADAFAIKGDAGAPLLSDLMDAGPSDAAADADQP